MKQRLREDIASASNTSLLKFIKAEAVEAELVGKIHGCDDYNQDIPDWNAIIKIVERREKASKRVPNCPECGTEQVQLVHWQTSTLRYKCRHCKHKFERDENGKA